MGPGLFSILDVDSRPFSALLTRVRSPSAEVSRSPVAFEGALQGNISLIRVQCRICFSGSKVQYILKSLVFISSKWIPLKTISFSSQNVFVCLFVSEVMILLSESPALLLSPCLLLEATFCTRHPLYHMWP